MVRTQIQFPDPLYRRLKAVAAKNDWPLAEVVRRASELYVQRFSDEEPTDGEWAFPTLDVDGDFLVDPADVHSEHEAINARSR